MAIDCTNRLRAVHAYFLGTAYIALGREDDAEPRLEISAAGEPSPFAKRAKQSHRRVGEDERPRVPLAAAYKVGSSVCERIDVGANSGATVRRRLVFAHKRAIMISWASGIS